VQPGVVWCSSLAEQSKEDLAATLEAVRRAGVTVVSLPMVNEWTQGRAEGGTSCTPYWRGITLLQELAAAGVPVAMASDNTRDQFFQYGDLDMLEVFTQGVRLGQLDRPIRPWPASVTAVPAASMHLPTAGRISLGAAADLVLFRARKFSELLSRPQTDRVRLRCPPLWTLLAASCAGCHAALVLHWLSAACRPIRIPHVCACPCMGGDGSHWQDPVHGRGMTCAARNLHSRTQRSSS
jgi:hypothetical protein